MTLVPRDYARWNVERGAAADGAYHRNLDYRRRKAAFAEGLLATAEQLLPGLRDHIDWQEAATPVTQERFTHSTGGTSYGIEPACDQIGPNAWGRTLTFRGCTSAAQALRRVTASPT